MTSRSTLALLLSVLLAVAQALAYPKTARKTCSPTFSGLTQTIRHSNNVKLGWMAVSGDSRGVEGVKAAKITKSSLPEMEWFISQAGPSLPFSRKMTSRPSSYRQLYEITAATHGLSPAAGLGGQQSFGQTCTDAHTFFISCSDCDHHDDSAWGCQIESAARDKCVQAKEDSGELMWKDCVYGQGANLPYQLFDISPLL